MNSLRARRWSWRFSGLSARVALLFLAWVLGTGLAYHGVLVAFTRAWLLEQLDDRTRALSGATADRLRVPMSFGDQLGMHEALVDLANEPEVVGVAVCDSAGHVLSVQAKEGVAALRASGLSAPWTPPARSARVATVEVRAYADERHGELREYARAIDIAPNTQAEGAEAAGELFGLADGRSSRVVPPPHAALGWLRVAVSTESVRGMVQTAANAGWSILLVAFVLGVVAVSLLMRVVVGPLGEAESLARAIAAGDLSRRLPIRGPDELGSLSVSLNRMADALDSARKEAAVEGGRLKATARVVLGVAQEARGVSEPRRAFEIVAQHLSKLTGCDGVALALPVAVPAGRREEVQVEFQKGRIGENALPRGFAFSPGEIVRTLGEGPSAVRFEPRGPRRLGRALEAAGAQSALAIVLPLPGQNAAILLLASARKDGFEDWQGDVIDAVTTHLLDALQAAQLRQRLEAAFAELERTRDSLLRAQNLRLASEMAAGAAHDFNNVLGAILGRAQLLKREHAAGRLANAELVRALSVIELAAKDGSETVRRLREFGQGRDERLAEPVDVAQTLKDAVEFTRARWEDEAQAAGRTIRVTLDAPAGLRVFARPAELREVAVNLLLNAIDAVGRTGEIRLTARGDTGHVYLEVKDDGAGMPPEVQARVFEPFYTTKGPRGTGMGLSVVYGIVQRLTGTIELASAPGEGATFRLAFPRVEAAPVAESALPVTMADPAAAPLRVLVIDDEATVRELLGDIVKALGHVPTVTAEPVAVAATFAPGSYDLVLTDVGMPDMNGWQLTAAVRAVDPRVLIALVTGWGEQITPAEVHEGGADLVIAKPFTIEDVAGVCAAACDRRPKRAA